MINKFVKIDYLLFFTMVLLSLIGILFVYSASSVYALEKFDNQYLFLKKQILFFIVGLIISYFIVHLNHTRFKTFAIPLFVFSFILLLSTLVFAPGYGVGNVHRWLRIGSFTIQPSEIVKLTSVILFAYIFGRKYNDEKSLNKFLLSLFVLSIVVTLLFLQPDFGTASTITLIFLAILYVAGMRFKYFIYFFISLLAIFVYISLKAEYRINRILTFLNPWQDPDGKGFQIIQSFLAFGSGGVKGVGLGESKQKLFYLPEAHTDFILSLIGEEVGFIGLFIIIALFLIFITRGIVVSLRSADSFGKLLAFGLTSLIGIEVLMNFFVVIGLVPTKGMVLPFIGYGGSSLLSSMMATAIIVSVSRREVT